MVRIAPEGWPFIIILAVITLVTYFLGKPWMAVGPLFLFLFMVFFFRDPSRVIPSGEGIIVSPADGKVIQIRTKKDNEYLNEDVTEVSIFMSPLDVHVNRSPYDGTVELVKHSPGGFHAAYTDEAALKNENIAMVLRTSFGRVLIRQVAGFVARRAVCRVKPDDVLKRGERYGIIKFGSRVDTYLPKTAQIKVMVGQRVKAGETILANVSE
jgi:phosphatidylserine decarboxylase